MLIILRVGLAALLLTPLIFHKAFVFPYVAPRTFFFQTVAFLLGIISMIWMLRPPRRTSGLTVISKALVIFFAANVVTTITSIDPLQSFLGSPERAFGFLLLVAFGLLFIITTQTLTNERDWNWLFIGSITVSLLTALHFLFFGKPSLLGNPLYLSAYLLFHIFFATHLFSKTKILKWRIILGVIIGIEIFAMLATQIRGAFLGLFAGIVITLGALAWNNPGLRKKLIAAVLVLVIGFAGIIFLSPKISKLTDFSLEGETVRSRFAIWGIAWEGIKEKPILGWGRENFIEVFAKHYNPKFDQAGVGEYWEDRTHNFIFEELVGGGIAGLAGWLMVLAAALYAFRKHPIWLGLLAAYTMQNLFGVESINSALPFFLALGYGDFLERSNLPEKKIMPAKIQKIAAVLGAGILFIIWIRIIIPEVLGNYEMLKATQAVYQKNASNFSLALEKAKKRLEPFPSSYRDHLGHMSFTVFKEAIPLAKKSTVTYLAFADPVINELRKIHSIGASEASVELRRDAGSSGSGLRKLAPRRGGATLNRLDQRWKFIFGKLLFQKGFITEDIAILDESQKIFQQLLEDNSRKIIRDSLKNIEEARMILQNLQ